MYSSEYTSGFSWPGASHLAHLLHLVTNGNVEQTPRDSLLHSYKNGASPIRISRQSGYVGIVERSLNRHDNHSGICGPVLRTMPVSIRNSWASNIGGCKQ